ncbi:MAG: hypothetical protein U1F42_05440 [Candidatus Competibacteraceae bacterium]
MANLRARLATAGGYLADQFIANERTLMKTSTGQAPWKIVEGYDERYRSVTVATIIRAIRFRLEEARPAGRWQ